VVVFGRQFQVTLGLANLIVSRFIAGERSLIPVP
jgi:hypothetical protein